MKLEARESFYRGPTVGAKMFWRTLKGGDNCIDSIENMNNFCIQEKKWDPLQWKNEFLFIDFLWRFLWWYHGGSGWLTPPPPCHCGDSGWLFSPTLWVYTESWIQQLFTRRGRRPYTTPWGVFSAKFPFWIEWVGRLGHLAIGPMPFIFGP
jgi:hypothetical protein